MAWFRRAKAERHDGWENEITGLGTYERDKRTRAAPVTQGAIPASQLSALYDGDALVRKVVQKPVKAALRKGWEIEGISEAERKRLDTEYKRLKVMETVRESRYWEALYGGALTVFGAADQQIDLAQPLSMVRDVRYIRSIPKDWVTVVKDARGDTEHYRISPDIGVPYMLHATRAHMWPGLHISPVARARNGGWGFSVLQPVYETIRDFAMAYGGAFLLTADFATAIYKMTGLREALAQNKQAEIKTRLQIMDMAKSIAKLLVVDANSGEDYERKSTSVAGLPELLDRFERKVAADIDMPMTVLFGMSPGGLSATGESDLENWYARLGEEQAEHLEPAIRKITTMLLGHDNYEVAWPPLWEASAQETAATQLVKAQAAQIYYNIGAVTADEIRGELQEHGPYELDTSLDVSTLQELQDQLAAEQAARAAEDG